MTRLPPPRLGWLLPALLALAACAHTPSARDDAAVVGDAPPPASATLDHAADASMAPATAQPWGVDATAGDEGATDPSADATTDPAPVDAATSDDSTIDPVVDPLDARTQAERDFDALYGAQSSDPFADPTLPAPATLPQSYDPWEGFNRRMHRFNNAVDRRVAKPLARAYVAATPRPVRLGVSNFFNNLGQPVSAVNALLQGKPKQALQSLGRFLLNTTLGIGGIFDPASDAKLPNRGEDFGQTLGIWGWKQSRYIEVPLFGPRTVRDLFGMVGDAPLAPLRQVGDDPTRVFLQGLQLVDLRTQLMAVDGMREGAADDYALVRDSWLQRRNYQIFGDRQLEEDEALPDYLREEYNPTVPIDAIPVTPMGTP
jgi:phospholipid-binding lipoprotein MlaA